MNRPSRPASANRARTQQLGIGPLVLIGAGVLILLSLAVWKLSSLPVATTPQAENPNEIPYPEIARVSLIYAKTAFDNQQALFVDVRDTASYDLAHIKGALNIPVAEIENRLSDLPKDRWIILYCT
jgi:hypothetical protein